MFSLPSRIVCATASSAMVLCAFSSVMAQETLPEIVVTATRSPTAIADTGSAISVINSEEIAKQSPKDITDVLRTVPGLDVTPTGGSGSTTAVRMRGGNTGQTLVMIDGIRVNDPSEGSNAFDFSRVVPSDVERIEVLRGPQSALYGSDAMGGVINIITKKGKGTPKFTTSFEGGSYGSYGGNASVSGSQGPVSYAFSVSGYNTDGFSRYGYRIGRIERRFPNGLESDSNQKVGMTGRVAIDLSDTTQLEIGGFSTLNVSDYDAGWGKYPDTPSHSRALLIDGYARLKNVMLDGRLTNTVTISGNVTNRSYRDITYSAFGALLPVMNWERDQYRGNRLAAEYQGDIKLDKFGLLTLGAKTERENMQSYVTYVAPRPSSRDKTGDYGQTTNSAYALYQFSPLKNLHLSLGGRLDAIDGGDQFATWRATAAYEIEQTQTTLRTSLGTGAKAPTLFQLYSPLYGNPNLDPENSFGYDVGVDQKLFDGRVKLSATYFANRFRDLIDFTFDPVQCPTGSFYGCYLNVKRARTHGVELAGSFDVVRDALRINATYTYLHAINSETGLQLARRPAHSGRLGLAWTPVANWTIEPSVVMMGERYSSEGQVGKLAPYARLDARIEYKINDTFTAYIRGENLTNAHYQDVLDYGTAGRSVYGGIRAQW